MEISSGNTAYAALLGLLEARRVPYRLIDHPPEGHTDLVSRLRGHDVDQAAKCIVLMVKLGKRVTKYVLAVVPGTAKVDLPAVRALMGATYVSFASPALAEQLSGCAAGTILPFPVTPGVELLVDPALLRNDEIYFNAGRLDRSIALRTRDYVALAQPRLERIAAGDVSRPEP